MRLRIKLYYSLIFAICSMAASGQTKIASHTLKLSGPKHFQQALNAVNPNTNEVYVFAADKETLTILKLNPALFFTGEFKTERPGKGWFMAGCDFSAEGQPIIYWATTDYEEMTAIQYDITNKQQKALPALEGTDGDRNVAVFSNEDAFFILSLDPKSDDRLVLRRYDNGRYSRMQLDFSGSTIKNSSGKNVKVGSLLEDVQLTYLDTREWQPLYHVTQPAKLFVNKDQAILTFDLYPAETLALSIGLDSGTVNSKRFPASNDKRARSNSFLSDGKLYQVSSTQDKLDVRVYDFESAQLSTTLTATPSDTISFRSSPLLSQTGSAAAQEIKTSKKFLKKLSTTSPGISVYKMPGYNFVTIGGTRSSVSTGEVLLGVSLGVGVVLTGGSSDLYFGDIFAEQNLQNIYFEALMDDEFKIAPTQPLPLYVDHLSEFFAANPAIALSYTFPYKDTFLVGYLDENKGEYILRQFSNGYYEPFAPATPQ